MNTSSIQNQFKRFSPSGPSLFERIRTLFLNLKQFPETFYFGFMIKQGWLIWFLASPIFFVVVPSIAIGLIGLAILDIIDLALAKNKNAKKWIPALLGSMATVFFISSLTISLISVILGITIVTGPWLMMTGLFLIMASKIITMGLEIFRVLESPLGSNQQKEHIQTLIGQLSVLLTVVMVIAMIFTVVIFPVSAPIAITLATLVTALSILHIGWRLLPLKMKETIKDCFGLATQEEEPNNIIMNTTSRKDYMDEQSYLRELSISERKGVLGTRFFTAPDYLSQLKSLRPEDRIPFLKFRIQSYQHNLLTQKNPPTRVINKTRLTQNMLENLDDMYRNIEVSSIHLEAQVFQSFWRESEMESLWKAYQFIQKQPLVNYELDESNTNSKVLGV